MASHSLKQGDSLYTVQMMDTFIARSPQMVPPQFKKGDKIETGIRVLDVFKNAEIGEAFNEKFISIKLQMDKSPADNDYVKSWYGIAEKFQREFNFVAYPSFLFFSPEGSLVYRGVGYKSNEALIALSKDAVDPNKQYFVLKQNYKNGRIKKPKDVIVFIAVARQNGDADFAKEVAKKYKTSYFDKLNMEQLYSIDNFLFIKEYYELVNSQDGIFTLFRNFPSKCDSLVPGLAKLIVNYVIRKEEITPLLNYNDPKSTDWDLITSNINGKYGKDNTELLLQARMSFAFKTKNWREYTSLKDSEISSKKVSPNDSAVYAWDLNISAWNTYLACNDSTALTRALSWSDRSIQILSHIGTSSEQYFDTKARILYKLGHVQEAIENERKAIDVGIEQAQKSGGGKGGFYDEYSLVLSRMKNGEPIIDNE